MLVTITIDGREYEVDKNETVLSACLKFGIFIPHLCFLRGHKANGRCGMCAIETGESSISLACLTPIREDLNIKTFSEKISSVRQHNLKRLLKHHSLDCFTCRKGGNCKLQKYGSMFNWGSDDFIDFNPEENSYIPIHNHIVFNKSKCINCNRCISFLTETCNICIKDISLLEDNASSDTDIIGTIVDLCPTAALMNDTYEKKLSKFNMKNIDTFDVSDVFMPPVSVLQEQNSIIAILSKNSKWMKDSTRFAYKDINEFKNYPEQHYNTVIERITDNILDEKQEKNVFVIGNHIDIESLMLIEQIVSNNKNCCIVLGNIPIDIIKNLKELPKSLAKHDAVFTIGDYKLSGIQHIMSAIPSAKKVFRLEINSPLNDIKRSISNYKNPAIFIFNPTSENINFINSNFRFSTYIIPQHPSQILGKYLTEFCTIDDFKNKFNKHDVKSIYSAGVTDEILQYEEVFNVIHHQSSLHNIDGITYLANKHFFESSLYYMDIYGNIVKTKAITNNNQMMSVNEFVKKLFKLVFYDNYSEAISVVQKKIQSILNKEYKIKC